MSGSVDAAAITAEQLPIPPNTTVQQDLTTAGQRKINMVWEYTQAVISIFVVMANMTVGVVDGLGLTKTEFPPVLSSALFLVIGFYFSRTNHAAIGGVGWKPQQHYEGR